LTISPESAGQWRTARLIYPFYCKLIEQFELEMFPCRDLDADAEETPEALQRVQLWLNEADRHIDASHIREMLQARFMLDEESLRALLLWYLRKENKTDSDRYKVDFLLGHYLAQNVAPGVSQRELNLARASEILEPILGENKYLRVLEELEACLRELEGCQGLEDLAARNVLEKGRTLKAAAGEAYFTPGAMVAFTRFNFLVRRQFIHFLENDLQGITRVLSELENRNVHTINCTPAGLAEDESTQSLRQMVKKWKKPFSGKYSDAHWFLQITKLRKLLAQKLDQAPARVGARSEAKAPAAESSAGASATSLRQPPPAQAQATPAAPGKKSSAPSPMVADAAPAKVGPGVAKKPAFPKMAFGKIVSGYVTASRRWIQQSIHELGKRLAQAIAFLKSKFRPSGSSAASPAASGKGLPPVTAPGAARGTPPMRAATSAGNINGKAAVFGVAAGAPASSAGARGKVVHQAATASVPRFIKQIAQQVQAAAPGSEPMVEIEGTLFELAEWELTAFRNPGDNLSGVLQRSAAVRAVLFAALARYHAGGESSELNAVLKMAYSESAMLQERVTQVRNSKGPNAAATLSASTRQLLELVEGAEQSILKSRS
jgi:hypothetical protein